MSRTLNLVEILLTSGRNLVMMGRFTEALEPLNRLAEFRNLPERALEELHALRAEIHFEKRDFKMARRFLTAAIALKPLNARHHHLMAAAIEEDDYADRKRAEMYYERALQIEPDNAWYWIDFANYLFKLDRVTEGLKAVRKAHALGEDDVDILGQVAEVLRREGYAEEATTKLRASLFAHHGSAAFRQLWQRHQFALIHDDQRTRRAMHNGQPVILRFQPAPSQGKYQNLGGKTIRMDRAEKLVGPTEQKPLPYKRPPKG
jgi:tetratricopeptide (TPR) repeat protein